jgi:hypothetical protein
MGVAETWASTEELFTVGPRTVALLEQPTALQLGNEVFDNVGKGFRHHGVN